MVVDWKQVGRRAFLYVAVPGVAIAGLVTAINTIGALNTNNVRLAENINAVAEGRNQVDVEHGKRISVLEGIVFGLEGAVVIPTPAATSIPTPEATVAQPPYAAATATPTITSTPQPTSTPTSTPPASQQLTSDQLKYGCVVPPENRPATPYNTSQLISEGKLTPSAVVQITESNLEMIASSVTANGRYGPDVKDFLQAAVTRAKSGYQMLIAFYNLKGNGEPCSDFAVTTFRVQDGRPVGITTRYFRPTDPNEVARIAGFYGVTELKPLERK